MDRIRRQPSEALMMANNLSTNAPGETLARARRERERAEGLLRQLQAAKVESERNLASSNERDPLKAVTGRSSFDNAIATTRRLIETLDRTCLEAERAGVASVTTCCGGRHNGAHTGVHGGSEARMGALVGPHA